MAAPLPARMPTIVAVLAPLLSIKIFSNTPFRFGMLQAARPKNRLGEARLRCARRRKSMVRPVLSTARYKRKLYSATARMGCGGSAM